MTLGRLLLKATGSAPLSGDISGTCVLCSCKTGTGIKLRNVVSSAFTGWSALFSGNCMCPECAFLFSDQVFRKKSWIASPVSGFHTFKNDEAQSILFSQPEPPFFIYLAKMGHKQSWLSCLHKIAHNRNRYFFSHESYDMPILFDRDIADKYLSFITKAIDEYGLTKTELLSGNIKTKTWARAIEGQYDGFLKEVKSFKKDPLWEVMVDVYRGARNKTDRAAGAGV